MSSYYIDAEEYLIPTRDPHRSIITEIPPGNYKVNYEPRLGGFYLEKMAKYTNDKKIYGNAATIVDRVFRAYAGRSQQNMGVLLTGLKGSGKSLTARLIAIRGYEQGMPCLLVAEPFTGPEFATFLADTLEQPCVIVFDEFEKVYEKAKSDDDDSRQQNPQIGLLSLLDGAYPSNKLLVFTANRADKISSLMYNRPGRMFYHINYTGLDAEFIREYCADVLHNKGHIEAMVRVATLFWEFNFDMLQAFVSEMNLHNEGPIEVMKYLNATPDRNLNGLYHIKLYRGDTLVEKFHPIHIQSHPWDSLPIEMTYPVKEQQVRERDGKRQVKSETKYHTITFTHEDLVTHNADKREFFFNKEVAGVEWQLHITPQIIKTTDYDGYIYGAWDAEPPCVVSSN